MDRTVQTVTVRATQDFCCGSEGQGQVPANAAEVGQAANETEQHEMQSVRVSDIDAMLDERDALITERDQLRTDLARATALAGGQLERIAKMLSAEKRTDEGIADTVARKLAQLTESERKREEGKNLLQRIKDMVGMKQSDNGFMQFFEALIAERDALKAKVEAMEPIVRSVVERFDRTK
jgi:hypothetical protein